MKYRILIIGFAAIFAAALPAFAAPAADHTGVWKWTTQGRNGQPEETVLKLAKADDGSLIGTLHDRAGETVLKLAKADGSKEHVRS